VADRQPGAARDRDVRRPPELTRAHVRFEARLESLLSTLARGLLA